MEPVVWFMRFRIYEEYGKEVDKDDAMSDEPVAQA